MDEDTTYDFPDTPAARAATWFFHNQNTQGRDLTVEEIAQHMAFEPPWIPENSLERFRSDPGRDPTRKVVEMKSATPYEFELWEVDGAGRRWHITFRVQEHPPHAITFMDFRADLGPGVRMRKATPEDTTALAAVERASPLVLGEKIITYDRGDDFLAFTRLMEEDVCYLVENDEEILGTYACASHMIRIAGEDHRAMLFHHLRIPANQAKRGFFSALNMQMFDHYAEIYDPWWKENAWAPYAYIQVANAAAMRLGGPGSWSFGPLRLLLDCEALAGPPHGRTAEPTDAGTIVDIINSCHEREAMFRPYSVDSLVARLERAPDLYSWGNVLVGDGAVVGVWSSGLRVTTEVDNAKRDAVRASVLDHGFVAGAEDELERLIRAWCATLVELGTTEVSCLASESSPAYPLLKRLAFDTDAFDFKMAIDEPEEASTNGLYVDPIYF